MRHCIMFFLSLCISGSLWGDEVWKITSLEWPPFTGKNLPDGGSAIKALREALKTQNITLEVEYYPWTRALQIARNPEYIGVFPCWPEDIQVGAKGFENLPALFYSPIVIAQNKKHPLNIKSLDDLQGLYIGVVQDYSNTEKFNELVKQNRIKIDISQSDKAGIQALNAGRTDGMLIDNNVMKYIITKEFPAALKNVEASPQWHENKPLLLAISSTNPKKIAIKNTYTKAISSVNGQMIVDEANMKIFENNHD